MILLALKGRHKRVFVSPFQGAESFEETPPRALPSAMMFQAFSLFSTSRQERPRYLRCGNQAPVELALRANIGPQGRRYSRRYTGHSPHLPFGKQPAHFHK